MARQSPHADCFNPFPPSPAMQHHALHKTWIHNMGMGKVKKAPCDLG